VLGVGFAGNLETDIDALDRLHDTLSGQILTENVHYLLVFACILLVLCALWETFKPDKYRGY
jgi:hypothetical protein